MIEILKSGLYDSIQDLGRFGVQDYGVPYSGAMDLYSASTSNAILGNSPSDAVLEITIIGPKLKFHYDTEIALSGADLCPKLNSYSIRMNTCYQVSKGDVLSFGKRQYGCRTYLAVKQGFQTELVMNSRSMYNLITQQSVLKKGDELVIFNANKSKRLKTTNAAPGIEKSHFGAHQIEVYKGLEFNLLTNLEQEKLLTTEFTVSKDSNRMAYQINEIVENNSDPIMTSLVLPGTIQLTPSGKLLILMRDAQVTGGYPRIFQVSEQSINQLSQKFFGDKFRFKCLD